MHRICSEHLSTLGIDDDDDNIPLVQEDSLSDEGRVRIPCAIFTGHANLCNICQYTGAGSDDSICNILFVRFVISAV